MSNAGKLHPSLASSDSPHNPRVMRVSEIAEYLKLHPTTIYRLLKRQAIPGFKIGNDWRFNVEEIDRWRLASTARRSTS
jgi:excisionase family DNA binding protein